MEWLRWIAWGVAGVVGTYLAIVFLFVFYFALASYIPLLYRKALRFLRGSNQRPDPLT